MNPVAVTGLTCWDVLGIPKGAPSTEVKKARRDLSMALHPDLMPNGGAMLLIVNAAAEACCAGGSWPIKAVGSVYQGAPVPRAPAPPRKPPVAKWRENQKGNWSKRLPDGSYTTAYLKGPKWRWLGPDPFDSDETHYHDDFFDTAEEAMADSDRYYKGG